MDARNREAHIVGSEVSCGLDGPTATTINAVSQSACLFLRVHARVRVSWPSATEQPTDRLACGQAGGGTDGRTDGRTDSHADDQAGDSPSLSSSSYSSPKATPKPILGGSVPLFAHQNGCFGS
jgi:hypothetical protein